MGLPNIPLNVQHSPGKSRESTNHLILACGLSHAIRSTCTYDKFGTPGTKSSILCVCSRHGCPMDHIYLFRLFCFLYFFQCPVFHFSNVQCHLSNQFFQQPAWLIFHWLSSAGQLCGRVQMGIPTPPCFASEGL